VILETPWGTHPALSLTSTPQRMLQQIIFFEIFIFSELHHLQSRLQIFQTLLPNLKKKSINFSKL